jgi:hypothetical protein
MCCFPLITTLTKLQLAAVSIGNSIQTYTTLSYTKRVYSAKPNEVTGLSARTFGTWTFVTAIVRIIAAYHLNDPTMYLLAFVVFLGANLHFMSEWLVFKTTKWGEGLAGPVIISSVSLVWMLVQWDFYTNL